jgi:hypothetical protein
MVLYCYTEIDGGQKKRSSCSPLLCWVEKILLLSLKLVYEPCLASV